MTSCYGALEIVGAITITITIIYSRKQELRIERAQFEIVQKEISTRCKKTFFQPKNC